MSNQNNWHSADASMIYSPSAGDGGVFSQSAAEPGNEADIRRGATVISTSVEIRRKTIVVEPE